MNISEMIAQLEALKNKHGDLQVYYSSDGISCGHGYIVETITHEPHLMVPDYNDENENNDDVCVSGIFIRT